MTKGQLVQYASRALTQTERNYAQIEKEMLSIVFGLERFERFVFGRHVVMETDHKPPLPTHKKSLLSAPKRLQRMLLRTQRYDYSVVYKKGTEMYLADTLSRLVTRKSKQSAFGKEEIFQTEFEQELENTHMASHIAVSQERLTEFQLATREDPDMCRLTQVI